MGLARRFVSAVPARVALLLALLPLALHGGGPAARPALRSRGSLRDLRPLARDRRERRRAAAREPDPLGPRVRQPALARGREGGRGQRPASPVEPVRPRGQPRCWARPRPACCTPRRGSASGCRSRSRSRSPAPSRSFSPCSRRFCSSPTIGCRLPPRCSERSGWGFSTFVLFWLGWSVGPSTATFPLLLLGLRRLAREPGRRAIGLTTAALWLSFCGGHPESFFHGVAAAGVYFLWELFGSCRKRARPSPGDRSGPGRRDPRAPADGPAALSAARSDPAFRRVPRAPPGAGARRRAPVGADPRGRAADAAGRASVRARHLREEPRADRARRRLGDAARLRRRGALPARRLRALAPSAPRARPRDLPGLPRGGAPLRGERSGRARPDVASARLRPGPQLPARVSRGPRPFGARGLRRGASDRRRARRRPAARPRLRRRGAGPRRRVPVRATGVRGPRPARTRSRGRSFSTRWCRSRCWGSAALALPARARVPAALVLLCGQRFLEMRGVYPTLPARVARAALARSRGRPRRHPSRVVAAGHDLSAERRGPLRPRGRARLRVPGARPIRGHVSDVVPRAARVVQPRDRSRLAVSLALERPVRDRRSGRSRRPRDGSNGRGTRR